MWDRAGFGIHTFSFTGRQGGLPDFLVVHKCEPTACLRSR